MATWLPHQNIIVVDPKLSAGRGEQFSASYVAEAERRARAAQDDPSSADVDDRDWRPLDAHGGVGFGFDEDLEAVAAGEDAADVNKPIPQHNVGYRMLQRMGWSNGKGLGRNENGIVEPIRAGIDMNVRLGLGKQEEDDFYTAADGIQRKRLEVEIQATESADRTQRREELAETLTKIQAEITEIKRTFLCETCSKQYTSAMELDAHLSSYDHHHKKRLIEMKQMTADRTKGDRAKKEAKAMDKEMARLQKQAEAALQRQAGQQQPRMTALSYHAAATAAPPLPSPVSSFNSVSAHTSGSTAAAAGWGSVPPLPPHTAWSVAPPLPPTPPPLPPEIPPLPPSSTGGSWTTPHTAGGHQTAPPPPPAGGGWSTTHSATAPPPPPYSSQPPPPPLAALLVSSGHQNHAAAVPYSSSSHYAHNPQFAGNNQHQQNASHVHQGYSQQCQPPVPLTSHANAVSVQPPLPSVSPQHLTTAHIAPNQQASSSSLPSVGLSFGLAVHKPAQGTGRGNVTTVARGLVKRSGGLVGGRGLKSASAVAGFGESSDEEDAPQTAAPKARVFH